MTARGLRNNNPGNIRIGDHWIGLATMQTDPDFCVFRQMKWGCRALVKLLVTYVTKHHLTTVSLIIARWAPPEDNNPTSSYARNVSRAIGHDPDERLTFTRDIYLGIARAIALQENGVEAEYMIKPEDWEFALNQALGKEK